MRKTITIIVGFLLCTWLWADIEPKEGYIIHTVRWFEDLTIISNKYGVPDDIIVSVNSLSGKKLTPRTQLYIPTSEKYWIKPDQNLSEASDSTIVQKDSIKIPVAEPTNYIKAGIILNLGENQSKKNNNLDFYCGALLAAKNIAEKGINVDLNVKDLARDRLATVYDDKNSDFVIGPISFEDMGKYVRQCDSSQIVISPLDPKTELIAGSRKYFVQAPSKTAFQYADALRWSDEEATKAGLKNNLIVLTYSGDSNIQQTTDYFRQAVPGCKFCECGVSGEIDAWPDAYVLGKQNSIIVAISHEAALSNAIRNIGLFKEENIRTYCNSRAQSCELISVESLHRIECRVLCSYYVDRQDELYLSFIRTYRALFNNNPSQFAFQGYDLLNFMAQTWTKYGSSWSEFIDKEEVYNGLQASFKLERLADAGLANTGTRRIIYRTDCSVELILQ